MYKKRSARSITFGLAFSVAIAAIAFFMASWLSDGSHEGETGEGTEESVPTIVSFADGVTPENPVPVSVELNNTSSEVLTFHEWTMDVETPSFPKCGNEWLAITAKGTASGADLAWWQETLEGTRRESGRGVGEFSPGTRDILAPESEGSPEEREGGNVNLWLEFKSGPAGTTDQSACENTPVVVNSSLRE